MYQDPPINLEYVFDVVCPWCFVGKRRLERAIAMRPHMHVNISWRPFLLNPDLPMMGMPRQNYLERKFGGGNRVERMHSSVQAAADKEGLQFNFSAIDWMPNTVLAHRLIQYAAQFGRAADIVEALFHGFFVLGMDIGHVSVLYEIAQHNGLNADDAAEYIESERDFDRVFSENARAHRAGINGVPCLIINQKFALAGAQEPIVLLRLLDAARENAIEQLCLMRVHR